MSWGRLLALLLLVPGCAAGLELDRGPYLQSVGSDRAAVVWRTDDPCDGAIAWGLAPDALSAPTPVTRAARQHVAELTGLEPDTTYFYEGTCDGLRVMAGTAAVDRWFRTAPPRGDARPFRAWILGDSGNGSLPQRAAYDAAVAHWGQAPPDLFLHMGDMAYGGGTDLQFTAFFFAVYEAVLRNVPTFPTMGNHEGANSFSATQRGPYYEAYVLPTDGALGGVPSGSEAYYSYDWGNVHFVVLDSHQSDRSPAGPMLTWLADDLTSTDQQWIVAYWHHPPYTKGSHDSDLELNHIQMRENALPIFEAGGVDLVLGGHSHTYERSYLVQGSYETPSSGQGIVSAGDGRSDGDGAYLLDPGLASGDGSLYVVAGHGGASVRQASQHPLHFISDAEYGSVLMDVRGPRLSLRNVVRSGEVADRVTLLKGPALDVTSPDGGEVLVPGTEHPIRWGGAGIDGPVRLEWRCDEGVPWEPVGEADAADGELAWTVPPVRTTRGRVRVTSLLDPKRWDESDGAFQVVDLLVSEPVPPRSRWRALDGPEDPGDDWVEPGFDDSGWLEGRGELGFGGGEDTALNGAPVRPSYLFRATVELPGTPEAVSAQLRVSDGYVLWVNGQIAAAANVEGGMGLDDWASAPGGDGPVDVVLEPELLTAGENTLAVMVKQASAEQTRLRFDLTLQTTYRTDAPSTQCPTVPEVVADDDDSTDGDDDDSADGGAGCGCAGGGAAWLPLLALGWPRRRRRR